MPFVVIDTYKVNDDNILDFSSRQELLLSDAGIVSMRDQLSDTLVDMWQTADYISQVMDWWDDGHDVPLYIGDATLNELDRITYRKSTPVLTTKPI